MMITIKFKETVEKQVKYLKAECGVRYWEDAEVNGTEDEDGILIPCRVGDSWCPVIDIETGTICDWPEGTTASTHYKVCDAGVYHLLDAEKDIVRSIDGYVPKMMCPKKSGYGDYVIMDIDGAGKIDRWEVILDEFEEAKP